jgi:hypothetical protein
MEWEDKEGKVEEIGGLNLWEKRVEGNVDAEEAAAGRRRRR